MATEANLQRLRALVDTLAPLGRVQRGELIRAQDWNLLVSGLLEVGRAVLTQEENPTVPPHEHKDEVSVAWLVPALRSLVERGPLADPAGVARLIDFGTQLTRLTTRVEQSAVKVDEFRGRLTDVQTRDLLRQAEVTDVRRTIDGMSDARADIQTLRETLGAVQRDVRVATEVATRLTVNGQVIDVAALVTRVGNLEQLRERLRTPTGDLFDAAQLEVRFTQLRNTFITQDQLDDALDRRQVEIPPNVLSGLEDRVNASVSQRFQSRLDALTAEIRAETTDRLAGVNEMVARAVSNALPDLRESLTQALRPQIDAAQQAAVAEALAAAQRNLDQRAAEIRTEVAQQVTDLQGSLVASVREELARQLPAQLATIRQDVVALSERLQATTTRVDRQEATLDRHETTLRNLSRDQLTLEPRVRESLIAVLDSREAILREDLQRQFVAADAASRQRIEASIGDARRTVLDEAARIASENASLETRAIRNQILAEMRAIAREEAAAALSERVRGVVGEAVQESFASVPGLVAQEVGRATANLRAIVRQEIDAIRIRPGGGFNPPITPTGGGIPQ
jgi:hypothetical protein